MKPSEKQVLDILRATTLASISESDFASIKKAVEEVGILNLTGTAQKLVKSAVQKHGGGGHDQAGHGSWAGGGTEGASATGGKVDSFTQKMLDRGKKALEGNDYKKMMADYDKMESSYRKKLSKPSSDEEYGDPQDLANTDFYKKYGAFPEDVSMYAEAAEYVGKAKSVSVGDFVSWNSSGGRAEGKVSRIIRSGKINVPDSSFSIEGTEDDPAALIVLYRDGKPTDTKVGHKVSTLKKK
jgi:hypothetical protein